MARRGGRGFSCLLLIVDPTPDGAAGEMFVVLGVRGRKGSLEGVGDGQLALRNLHTLTPDGTACTISPISGKREAVLSSGNVEGSRRLSDALALPPSLRCCLDPLRRCPVSRSPMHVLR